MALSVLPPAGVAAVPTPVIGIAAAPASRAVGLPMVQARSATSPGLRPQSSPAPAQGPAPPFVTGPVGRALGISQSHAAAITVAVGAIALLAVLWLALRAAGGLGGRRESRRPGFLERRRARRQRLPRSRGRVVDRHTRLQRRILGIALLLVAAAVGVEAVRLLPAAKRAYDGARELRQAAAILGTDPSRWGPGRIQATEAALRPARARLDAATPVLARDPLVRLSARMPLLGDQTRAALALAQGSRNAGQALDDMLKVARDYRAAGAASGPAGSRLLDLIQTTRKPLDDAAAQLGPALDGLRGSLSPHLVGRLRLEVQRAVAQLGPIQAEAAAASAAAGLAPAALGADGPRTYLLLFENPAELRPAGGFAGAVGTVSVDGGVPSGLQIKSHDYYNPLIRQPLPVPYPLDRWLTFYHDSLELGDAGWDPDFPSSAQVSEQLFTSATGQPLDGTVAFDPYAVEALLGVVGAVDVPPYGSFDSGNFFAKLDVIVNVQTGPGEGKQALAPIAQAVLQRVLDAPATDWPRLLLAFQQQAGQRHIQVWMHDPRLAAAAQLARYDGALLQTTGDYLMVVDGNVGATKGDYFVHKAADLQVQMTDTGLALHELTLTYQMPAPADAVDAALNPGDGSYRDYLRVYLPQDATVASFSYEAGGAPGEGGLDRIGEDHGKRYVGIFLRVPRGATGVVHLGYASAVDDTVPYEVYVQKQAGTPGTPYSLTVSLPGAVRRRSVDLSRDQYWVF